MYLKNVQLNSNIGIDTFYIIFNMQLLHKLQFLSTSIIKKCSFRLKHWYGMESQFSKAFPFSFMHFHYYTGNS